MYVLVVAIEAVVVVVQVAAAIVAVMSGYRRNQGAHIPSQNE